MRWLSGLHRSIAPWHPATAWALAASFIVFIGAWHSHGFHHGVRGAVAVFLAWAITRELAPRRAVASLLAPFAAVAFAIPARTDLLACLLVLLAARIAARSTGTPLRVLDVLALVLLVWWASLDRLAFAAALVLAAVVSTARPRVRARVLGAALLVVSLVTAALDGTMQRHWVSMPYNHAELVLLVVLAASALLLVLVPLPVQLAVRDDRGYAPLRGGSLRSARLVAVLAVLAHLTWNGTSAPFDLSSVSAALVAAAVGGARARAAAPSDTLAP